MSTPYEMSLNRQYDAGSPLRPRCHECDGFLDTPNRRCRADHPSALKEYNARPKTIQVRIQPWNNAPTFVPLEVEETESRPSRAKITQVVHERINEMPPRMFARERTVEDLWQEGMAHPSNLFNAHSNAYRRAFTKEYIATWAARYADLRENQSWTAEAPIIEPVTESKTFKKLAL